MQHNPDCKLPTNGACHGSHGNGHSETDVARLKDAIKLLESLAAHPGLLTELSVEERRRLVQAAGQVYCPEPATRRRLVKGVQRKRKALRREQDQKVLSETGIRALRRKPVF